MKGNNIKDIHSNGKIYNEPDRYWPDGLTGEVYDALLGELI